MDQNSDQNRPGFTQRLLSKSEQEQQEIQDWLNGSGALVLGGIVVFIALFAIYALLS